MSSSIAELMSRLTPDPWRSTVGFSPDMQKAHVQMFKQDASDTDRIGALSDWLQKDQPCLFGRIAARSGFLSYCILTGTDLASSDEAIQDKIQAARLAWTKEGFYGQKNGFIILAMSEQIATATPDDVVKQLALRLCSLYLLEDIVPDEVFGTVVTLRCNSLIRIA